LHSPLPPRERFFCSRSTARIRAVDEDLKLKKHRSRDAGLADLLNYAAMVDDGVIVGKNGSFMAAWLYNGSDNASSTDEQREIVSFRINQALSGLGMGWMLHVDAVRRPAANYSSRDISHFPDRVIGGHRRGTASAVRGPGHHVRRLLRADADLLPAAARATQVR
jgi:hypothetical protein